jgi:hypothetical protein
MRRNLHQIAGLVLLAIVIIAVISLAQIIKPRNLEQAEIATADVLTKLNSRLAKWGVPAGDIKIIEQSPKNIEINFQVVKGLSLQERNWYIFLIEREAELAYLNIGIRLNSYHLIVNGPDGNKLYDGTIFLYPNMPSQELKIPPQPKISDQETKTQLLQTLDFRGMELASADVQSGDFIGGIGQLLTLRLRATSTDLSSVSEWMSINVPGLGSQLGSFNEKFGAQIVIVRLSIEDKQGNLLVDYIEDLERGVQNSWEVPGVNGNWYPQPAVPEELIKPTSSIPEPRKTAYPAPLDNSILPQTTPEYPLP